MQAAFILTLDTGEDTDLVSIAEDVAEIVDGQQGLIVVSCKPWPHPVLLPQQALGTPTSPTPLAGSQPTTTQTPIT